MRILVTAATKHGATGEIAQAIAAAYPVRKLWRVEGIHPHGFMGSHVGAALAERPVWLFSSGPVGDPPKPEEDPVDVAELLAATSARDHRVFAGKLVRKQLSFPERAIVSALRVPDGDFRDWSEITGWAVGIATALRSSPDPAGGS
jgi:menaquinone-dependent protoporphyrinogen oxidase